MAYYKTKYGVIIDENKAVIPMDESSELYQQYVLYLQNDGVVEYTDYVFPSDVQREYLERIRNVYQNKYLPDGVEYYNSFMDKIVLTIRSGQLTNEQGVIIKEYLGKGFTQLKRDGDWISAKYFIANVSIPEEHSFVEAYKAEAIDYFNNYINLNYPK